MNIELWKLEIKKGFLWAAMGIASAPQLLHEIVNSPVGVYKKFVGKYPSNAPIDPTPYPFQLPDDHPIAVMSREMGEKQGVNIKRIMMDETLSQYKGGGVYMLDRNTIELYLTGNPLNEKNGEALLRGTIGHELNHTRSMGHRYFRELGELSIILYGKIAPAALLAGGLAQTVPIVSKQLSLPRELAAPLNELAQNPTMARLLSSVSSEALMVKTNLEHFLNPETLDHLQTVAQGAMDQPLMAGVGVFAGLAALSAGIARLVRSYSHTAEHIADLGGAEIHDAQNMLSTLEYFQEQGEQLKNQQAKESAPKMSLSRIWENIEEKAFYRPFQNTHPDPPKRINALKKAFNVQEDQITTPTDEEVAQPRSLLTRESLGRK